MFRSSIGKGGRRMIELKIEGVCKECPFKDMTLIQYGKPQVFCVHETVCKFIGDPQGKERLYATMKTLEGRNADA